MPKLDNRLRQVRQARGKTLVQVAEASGINFAMLSRFETGQRDLKLKHLRPLGRALKCAPEDIIAPVADVPVVGTIGAGGQVFELRKNASGKHASDTVKAPRGIDISEAGALRVASNALEPMLPEGWVAFYEPHKRFKVAELIGSLCVVRLASGQSWLRQVKRGSEPDRYNLMTPFSAMSDDVSIAWLAPILCFTSPSLLDLDA